jgi:uncharacterized protein
MARRLATVDALELTPVELRVLGSLVEKELTTPDQYPLTLNALVLACNQKSNRDPIVDLDEETVMASVTSAKTKSLVRFVHPSHGRSALRYAHTLAEALDVSQRQLALLAVMMLRGPQTLAELRTRTARMAEFSDLDDLERELARLSGLETPLVNRQPRRSGQKEDRYAHLVGGDNAGESSGWGEPAKDEWSTPVQSSERVAGAISVREVEEAGRQIGSQQIGGQQIGGQQIGGQQVAEEQISELRTELAVLRRELVELREELDELRHQLGD